MLITNANVPLAQDIKSTGVPENPGTFSSLFIWGSVEDLYQNILWSVNCSWVVRAKAGCPAYILVVEQERYVGSLFAFHLFSYKLRIVDRPQDVFDDRQSLERALYELKKNQYSRRKGLFQMEVLWPCSVLIVLQKVNICFNEKEWLLFICFPLPIIFDRLGFGWSLIVMFCFLLWIGSLVPRSFLHDYFSTVTWLAQLLWRAQHRWKKKIGLFCNYCIYSELWLTRLGSAAVEKK